MPVSTSLRLVTNFWSLVVTNRPAQSSIQSESYIRWTGDSAKQEAMDRQDRAAALHRGEFETILDDFQGPLLRYAARLLSDNDSAQDIVQETFLRCLRNPPAVTETPRIGAWLYRVTHNLCMDALRSASRNERLKESVPAPDPAQAPFGQLMKNETRERVQGHLKELNVNQRAAILLYFQEEMSYREIAEVMELSVSNVGMSLHRGLKRLRELMNKEEYL